MSTFYTHSNVKRNGPQHVKDNVTDVFLCIAPLKTDSVAQIASKAIATTSFTGTDVTLADVSEDVTCTFNAKSTLDPSGTAADTDDIAVVYCSATENLIAIDVVDRDLTNGDGDTLNIPAAIYTVPELAAAV